MSEPPWALPAEAVLERLGTRASGLTEVEVNARAAAARALRVTPARRGRLRILAAQFLHPLAGVLLVAAAASVPVGAWADAAVIVAIVLASGVLGFVQETVAEDVVAALLAEVRARAEVLRGGAWTFIDADAIVPGDVLRLSAGCRVPGDARLLQVNALQVDESALTGESFPAAKGEAPVSADAPVARRSCAVFAGTHVVSGFATAVVTAVGREAALGEVATRLVEPRRPTSFELGMHQFGAMLARMSGVLVLLLFAINVLLGRPASDAFLFAVALGVGLVPELLPAIVTVTLAQGARRMARGTSHRDRPRSPGTAWTPPASGGAVVRRLSCIEDLGAVDVLCADKTGTLTHGSVRFARALDPMGEESARAFEAGWLNAVFESGYANPVDAALREAARLRGVDAAPGADEAAAAAVWTRVGEVPYDFARKRLSVLLSPRGREGPWRLVTKGQLRAVLGCCDRAETAGGAIPLDEVRERIEAVHATLADQGLRVLGVATRDVEPGEAPRPDVERSLTFLGFLCFSDPVKADASEALTALHALGLRLLIVTGDDRRAAARVWRTLNGRDPALLTGADVADLGGDALAARAASTDVFAEVDPNGKERLVNALRSCGRVVAFLGDGINDAPALRAADVGISVDHAADVAREAADVVLRRADLWAVVDAVRQGRGTMANTLTYVRYTSSANFGNMLSMAVASAFLPFLPLLPGQILLNNFLSDVPALAIATDRADDERLRACGRWDAREIRRFMIVFGAVSSVFDLATFAVLLAVVGGPGPGSAEAFRSGWFVESLLTEVLVLLVLRTERPFGSSRPSRAVLIAVTVSAAAALAVPLTAVGRWFGLAPLGLPVLATVVALSGAYLVATEAIKRRYFRGPAVPALGAPARAPTNGRSTGPPTPRRPIQPG